MKKGGEELAKEEKGGVVCEMEIIEQPEVGLVEQVGKERLEERPEFFVGGGLCGQRGALEAEVFAQRRQDASDVIKLSAFA